jgi:hypothetical protein
MNIGTVGAGETGLANGHPAAITSGKVKAGTVCKANGLLTFDKAAGEFEACNSGAAPGAACVALEPVAAGDGAARVPLRGTFSGGAVTKADGSPLSAAGLAAAQANSQIYFV